MLQCIAPQPSSAPALNTLIDGSGDTRSRDLVRSQLEDRVRASLECAAQLTQAKQDAAVAIAVAIARAEEMAKARADACSGRGARLGSHRGSGGHCSSGGAHGSPLLCSAVNGIYPDHWILARANEGALLLFACDGSRRLRLACASRSHRAPPFPLRSTSQVWPAPQRLVQEVPRMLRFRRRRPITG